MMVAAIVISRRGLNRKKKAEPKIKKGVKQKKNQKKKQNHVAVADCSRCRRRPFVLCVVLACVARWCGAPSSLVRGASAVVALEFAVAVITHVVVALEFAWCRWSHWSSHVAVRACVAHPIFMRKSG